MPKTRVIHHAATGGTVGSVDPGTGTRRMDSGMQSRTRKILEGIPFTSYRPLDVRLSGDSGGHPKTQIIAMGSKLIVYASEGNGIILEYGTDSMNFAASVVALIGNQLWKYPVTFLGAMRGHDKKNSDAPLNALTAGLFTAFADVSGVFATRQGGRIITSRHDTYGGSIDWHGRDIPMANDAFFAKVELSDFVDLAIDEWEARFKELSKKVGKHTSALEKLANRINISRSRYDKSLDYIDQVVVGGRARIPGFNLMGYTNRDIRTLKTRPDDDTPGRVLSDMWDLVFEKKMKGLGINRVLPMIGLMEHIRRDRTSRGAGIERYNLHEKWEEVFEGFLTKYMDLGISVARSIVQYWKRYSTQPNDSMDINGIDREEAYTDVNRLYKKAQLLPPRGVILVAKGAAGLRFDEEHGESFEPYLTFCKKNSIPVVLTASSRGEVTSLEYSPGEHIFKNDLAYFAGTMDADLVEPRMALMNHPDNRKLKRELVNLLETGSVYKREAIERHIDRQLLSGSHFRAQDRDETLDRVRMQEEYKIDTRIDLLGNLHAKQAILAAYLQAIRYKGIRIPEGIVQVLERN